MKIIQLQHGKVALIDDEDYQMVLGYKWYAKKDKNTYYVIGYSINDKNKSNNKVKLHRLIMGLEKGNKINVDHKNGDGLDNRKCNLRLATVSQNQMNRKHIPKSTSKYRGVYWNTQQGKWASKIKCKQKVTFLGYFIDEVEAAKAYDKKAKELFGEFAVLNVA